MAAPSHLVRHEPQPRQRAQRHRRPEPDTNQSARFTDDAWRSGDFDQTNRRGCGTCPRGTDTLTESYWIRWVATWNGPRPMQSDSGATSQPERRLRPGGAGTDPDNCHRARGLEQRHRPRPGYRRRNHRTLLPDLARAHDRKPEMTKPTGAEYVPTSLRLNQYLGNDIRYRTVIAGQAHSASRFLRVDARRYPITMTASPARAGPVCAQQEFGHGRAVQPDAAHRWLSSEPTP